MIRLQFVLGRDISSRFVAWYGNGYGGFSHVDAVLSDGTLLGARSDEVGGGDGVRIRSSDPPYEKWKRREVYGLQCSAAEEFTWEAWLRSELGHAYNPGAIWDFVLGRRDLTKRGRWICSELQTKALQKIAKLPTLPVPASQVTPNSLLLMFCAIGARGI